MPYLAHKYPNARVAASSAQRDWPGLLAERLEHPVGSTGPVENAVTELTIVLEGCGSVSRQLDGARTQTIDAVPGAMWLTPAGAREDFIDFESAIPQALHIYLAADRFGFGRPGLQQRITAISALRRDAPFRDSLVEEIALAICAELQAPTDAADYLIALLGLCLAARLLRAHTDGCHGPTPPRHASGPDTRRFAKVTEHVAAHLDHHLSVTELARVAFLSPSRFAHAFKASTGDSPQHYIRARRLDRAKVLLCDGILPLAEVAHRCGFSSQASFTKAFVSASGQSPGRYRRQLVEREPGCWEQEERAGQALVVGEPIRGPLVGDPLRRKGLMMRPSGSCISSGDGP
jgi:AraC family transcriptional regulator